MMRFHGLGASEPLTIPATTTAPEIVVSVPTKPLDPTALIQKQLDTVQTQLEQVKFVTVIAGSLIGAVAAAIIRATILSPWEEKKKAKRIPKAAGNPTRHLFTKHHRTVLEAGGEIWVSDPTDSDRYIRVRARKGTHGPYYEWQYHNDYIESHGPIASGNDYSLDAVGTTIFQEIGRGRPVKW